MQLQTSPSALLLRQTLHANYPAAMLEQKFYQNGKLQRPITYIVAKFDRGIWRYFSMGKEHGCSRQP